MFCGVYIIELLSINFLAITIYLSMWSQALALAWSLLPQYSFTTLALSSWDCFSKPCFDFPLPCFYLVSWRERRHLTTGANPRGFAPQSPARCRQKRSPCSFVSPLPRQPGAWVWILAGTACRPCHSPLSRSAMDQDKGFGPLVMTALRRLHLISLTRLSRAHPAVLALSNVLGEGSRLWYWIWEQTFFT